MCGIAGIISFNNKNYSKKIKQITESLHHRGPDNTGYYLDIHRRIFLGFKRLSIIDLSQNGMQPYKDQSGRYVMVFNGEIYNFNFLKNKFLKNVKFKSSSDTEVLIEGFAKFGPSFFNVCDGMFAACIYDLKEKKCFFF